MLKIKKAYFAAIFLGMGLLFPKTALADSVMINKEVTDSSRFYVEENGNLSPKASINTTDLYNMISEDNLYYKIEYKGKIGYVEKNHFYRLNHTSLVKDADIKKDPSDDADNLTSYKLKKGSKVTILEFINVDDFVKVSYEQDRFDNKFINLSDRVEKARQGFVETLTLDPVPVETIGRNGISPTTVTVDDEVANAERKIGYIHFKDLALAYRDQEKINEFYNYYNLLNASMTSRQAPSFETEPVYNLIPGQTYQATSELPQITVHMTGSQTGINLYSYAVKFLGNPYVFGGEDLYNGIDCSGFTMRVYQTIGISLPHFAQSQQRYGVEIPFGQEKAGDLVFFGTSLYNITHVGIADGYGNMVHASNPRTGIIISPIDNPISIKRIVN
ncbi:C40 family peptidase [uncultured Anaerococcus sp.]|uniref:C40 family peptidase n=1 Tax=uncultured Anaerococcus sp. TaxID=293428 RepID=UPI002889329D|nr:C40 family peptidase [uncultured Anaerococcus sp.]